MNVWEEVGRIQDAYGVASSTNALQDVCEKKEITVVLEDMIEKYRSLFERDSSAVGIVVCEGSEVVSLDFFGSRQLFLDLWPKMLKALYLSSGGEPGEPAVTEEDVTRFLKTLAKDDVSPVTPVDAGSEYIFGPEGFQGRYFTLRGVPVHLSVIRQVEPGIREIQSNQIQQ